MAITLDSLVFNTTLNVQPRVSSAVQADQSTGAFDLASKRIGLQVSTTNVQLSAFGQIKSSFVDIQTAGKSLSGLSKSSTTEDTTKAILNFAAAFNKTAQATSTNLNSAGNATNTLTNDGRANLANNDLKAIVTSGSNTADLHKIGINLNKDGTLSVDTQILGNALQANLSTVTSTVRDTLNKVGVQAAQIAAKELSSTGNIGGAVNQVNQLSSRANLFEATAIQQQQLASDSQRAVQQQVTNLGRNAAGSVAAYMQMFSL